MPPHSQSVVVVTGASSGVGRATALAFARKGAAVALVARGRETLETLAADCRGAGGQALVLPVDVRDEDTVADLARDVIAEFGRIDVWVNNAAVIAYGRLEEVPGEIWRGVIETNLFGTYHGIRAALPWLREQGSGTIINVSSILGKAEGPYQSAYVASKFALRALATTVRQETRDVPGIKISTVLTAAVDTPLFRSGANATGRQVVPPGPAIDARRVADAIVRNARRPRREITVGASTRMGLVGARISPALAERASARIVEKRHFTDESAPRTEGNVLSPRDAEGQIDGGWRNLGQRRRTGRLAAAGLLILGAAVAARRSAR